MLADLFKPAWKSSSADKRLSAVSAMDSLNSDNQKILEQLASMDDDISVRLAAIKKLSTVATTHEIARQATDSSVRAEAENRVNELLVAGGLGEAQYRELMTRYPELVARVAAFADINALRNEAIQGLTTGQLVEVLALTGYTDARQRAAEKLTAIESDTEVLESARKLLLGKDKNAERVLRDKIEEIREQQRKHAENLALAEKLIEEVEYFVNQEWRAEFKSRLLVHRNQWDNLNFEVDPVSAERYQSAREIIDSRFEQQQLVEQAHLVQQQLLEEVNAIVQTVTASKLPDIVSTLTDTQNRLEQVAAEWQQQNEISAADFQPQHLFDNSLASLESAYQFVLRAAEITRNVAAEEPDESGAAKDQLAAAVLTKNIQSLEEVMNSLQWPAELGELQVANELNTQLAEWRKLLEKQEAEHKQDLDRLHKKISSIFRFSRSGNLAGARQLCERVEKGLEQFDDKERKGLEERFDEARKALDEMRDWKNFASEPKYVELCEAMERLAESAEHPDKRSAEMKKLQLKWKAIGYSDVSEKYWSRFKEAADRVYQPCTEFFEKRHQVRQSNLEQRQKSLEQLRKLLEETDWDNNPDYRQIQDSLRDIINDFSAIKEVEYKDGQKQWKQFSKLRDQVKARLAVVYDANIKLKQELVAQAAALAEAPVREENLAKLKLLQSRWKQVGITRHKQDQKSWVEFKKYGDLVFDKVQEMRQGQRAEKDQQLDAYRNVIKAINKLASTAKDLAEADHQFSELQAAYEALPALPVDLPEKLTSAINRDYRHACDQFDQCHLRILNNKHRQQLDALRQKAGLCAQLEALGDTASEQQLQDIDQQWQAIELHDPVMLRRIEQRRESAQSAIDRAAIGEQRRMLCIQLEIAADVQSPPEDRERRMQYQLEQMNHSGLGHAGFNNDDSIEKLEIDWLCMPGAEAELQQKLDARFRQVLKSTRVG